MRPNLVKFVLQNDEDLEERTGMSSSSSSSGNSVLQDYAENLLGLVGSSESDSESEDSKVQSPDSLWPAMTFAPFMDCLLSNESIWIPFHTSQYVSKAAFLPVLQNGYWKLQSNAENAHRQDCSWVRQIECFQKETCLSCT